MKLPAGVLKGIALSFACATTIEECNRIIHCFEIEILLNRNPGRSRLDQPLQQSLYQLEKPSANMGFLYLPIWTNVDEGAEIEMKLCDHSKPYPTWFPRPIMFTFEVWMEYDGAEVILSRQEIIHR